MRTKTERTLNPEDMAMSRVLLGIILKMAGVQPDEFRAALRAELARRRRPRLERGHAV